MLTEHIKIIRKYLILSLTVAGILVGLGGCNTLERLSEIGEEPKFSTIENPTHKHNYKPISMPMPLSTASVPSGNSLWRKGSRAFFKDLRANQVGDIVTITISVNDEAELNNTSTRSRSNSENVDIDALLGYTKSFDKILPEAVNPADILAFDGSTSNSGTGKVDRDEKINLKVAAVVTQILPNGNMVVHGRQETRVNFEIRELQIAGIIRPQDISANNTITYEKIAEARLSYGGRGHISDFQQPRWGMQLIDVLMPF